jgi:NAD(P)-dependent dehydrogenase (short-subunit alcohol dehydrogenase family)
MSTRTYVVTGAASGIGAATLRLLREEGHDVIGVDLRGSDVDADLATPDGRAAMVDQIGARTDTVDAVIANAGTIGRRDGDVRVNYFGAVATLCGLRHLLAASAAPRAAATVSMALVHGVSDALVDACLAGDEERAAALVTDPDHPIDGVTVYASTKRALARWIRRHAPDPAWAGAGIALNAVAPGVIRTPMTAPVLDDPGSAELLHAATPMPLGGVAEPDVVARTYAFLTDAATTTITGQVLFVDGGAECVIRGDDVWR